MIKSGMTYGKHLTEENMYKRLQKMGQETNKAVQTAENWCTFCLLDNCLFLTSLFATLDTVTSI
jgi:hypoxanthine-guanine phosphoribosyltransferase